MYESFFTFALMWTLGGAVADVLQLRSVFCKSMRAFRQTRSLLLLLCKVKTPTLLRKGFILGVLFAFCRFALTQFLWPFAEDKIVNHRRAFNATLRPLPRAERDERGEEGSKGGRRTERAEMQHICN